MSNCYRVHTSKYLVAAGTAAVSFGAAVLMLFLREGVGVVLFLLITILFSGIAVLYGAVITVGADGICKSFWRIPMGSMAWGEIQEVGVVGTKIFKSKDVKQYGSRYIYFSPEILDESGRFQLAMQWPPRKMIYLLYTRERAEQIQAKWSQEMVSYNAGDIFSDLEGV